MEDRVGKPGGATCDKDHVEEAVRIHVGLTCRRVVGVDDLRVAAYRELRCRVSGYRAREPPHEVGVQVVQTGIVSPALEAKDSSEAVQLGELEEHDN